MAKDRKEIAFWGKSYDLKFEFERCDPNVSRVVFRKLRLESCDPKVKRCDSKLPRAPWRRISGISKLLSALIARFRISDAFRTTTKNHFARWWQFYFIMMFSDDLSIGHEPFKVALPFVLLWSCLLQEINRTLTRRQYATLVVVVWQSYHRPTIGGLP